jgi:hypothetical protein
VKNKHVKITEYFTKQKKRAVAKAGVEKKR